MKEKLMQMMMEKGKKLSPVEQDAKMSVLQHLRDMANDGLMGKLKGMKKVSVMSDSPEGMEEGLDKAKHMLNGEDEEGEEHPDMPNEGAQHEAMESPEEEQMEHATGEELHEPEDHPLSDEDIERKIQELMALKQQLKGKKA